MEERIEQIALSGVAGSNEMEIMINLRQKNALLRAQEQVESCRNNLASTPLDCLGVDMSGALEALGEITGKNLNTEVIERMFHDFCIGK